MAIHAELRVLYSRTTVLMGTYVALFVWYAVNTAKYFPTAISDFSSVPCILQLPAMHRRSSSILYHYFIDF